MDNRNLQLAQLWADKLEGSIKREDEPPSNITFWATLVTAYSTLAIAEKFYERDVPLFVSEEQCQQIVQDFIKLR